MPTKVTIEQSDINTQAQLIRATLNVSLAYHKKGNTQFAFMYADKAKAMCIEFRNMVK